MLNRANGPNRAILVRQVVRMECGQKLKRSKLVFFFFFSFFFFLQCKRKKARKEIIKQEIEKPFWVSTTLAFCVNRGGVGEVFKEKSECLCEGVHTPSIPFRFFFKIKPKECCVGTVRRSLEQGGVFLLCAGKE